jgi:hypothetical protein
MSSIEVLSRLHEWRRFSPPQYSQEDFADPYTDSESAGNSKFELKFEIGPPDLYWKRERWLMLADQALLNSEW